MLKWQTVKQCYQLAPVYVNQSGVPQQLLLLGHIFHPSTAHTTVDRLQDVQNLLLRFFWLKYHLEFDTEKAN